MADLVIEWAPFTLREGVSEAELLAVADAVQGEFLEAQDGFVKRELLHATGRQWCDLLYWASAEVAQRAMECAMGDEACGRYFALMVTEDGQDPAAAVQHLVVRRSYARRGG